MIYAFNMMPAPRKLFTLQILGMENKYQALQVIYDLVKDDPRPTSSALFPNEIIVRQPFAWDEVVVYLNQLRDENLIHVLLQSPTMIYLTDKGSELAAAFKPKGKNFMHSA